jgi:putative sterol carrier protein
MTNSASQAAATDDHVARFFDELGQRGDEPLLRKVSGRVRFDLVDGPSVEPRLVVIDEGRLTVARDASPADCTVRGELPVFRELVAGRMNFMAAVLRGELACDGDLELMWAIQRILPAPPRGWDPTAGTRST